MSYSVTVKNDKIVVSSSTVEHSVSVNTNDYEVSLARTGGQGSKGDSVSRVYLDNTHSLIIELVNSAGDLVEVINAGSLALPSLVEGALLDGDFLQYDGTQEAFVPHRLTTSSMSDIDNTGKEDGAILIYNGSTEKYTASKNIDNDNTAIIGGNF